MAYAIDTDGSGNAYVVGYTEDTLFPDKNAYDGTLSGSSDMWLAKFDTTQSGSSSLVYATFIGGSGAEGDLDIEETVRFFAKFGGVAVDANGHVWVTGCTDSYSSFES